jgi:NadR type nicotinamide-nucleotide adenylyltransferase
MEKRNSEIIKVAVVGPESTGKSTLALSLAHTYNSVWVPEFARDYLQTKSGKYTFDDLEYIAKIQLQHEEKLLLKANRFLFCDTNLIVIKIWSEFVFGKVCNYITEQVAEKKYGLTFLTDIDIPWEPDPLREHPNKREELFSIYKNELQKQNVVYSTISGSHRMRLESASKIINDLYLKNE